MKVISIGTDRKIFEDESAVRLRAISYGALAEEVHMIVFSKRKNGQTGERVVIAPNVFAYPTNSFSKLTYIFDAVRIGKKIADIILQNNEEHVLVTAQDPFECGYVAGKVAEYAGVKAKLHLQIHTDFLNPYFSRSSLLNRMRVYYSKRLLPEAHGIRVVSERIATSLAKSGIILACGPSVLPIFVDIKKMQNAQILPDADLRSRYPQFNFRILMASRLSSEKDFMTAVRAVRESVMHYKKTGLIIVGDGPEKETILRRAREAGIEGHVFIEPWAGRETLLSYYKTAHLFLSTSLYEGYGMSMVEAVATGLPVVATDAGIASGLLVGTKNVTTVCPVKGVKCLFDKIRWFVEDLEFRRRFPVEVTTRLPDFSYADEADYLSRYKADWERCFVETDTDNVDASLKNEDKK